MDDTLTSQYTEYAGTAQRPQQIDHSLYNNIPGSIPIQPYLRLVAAVFYALLYRPVQVWR